MIASAHSEKDYSFLDSPIEDRLPPRAVLNEPLSPHTSFLSHRASLVRLDPSALEYRFPIASVQSSQPLGSDRPSVGSPTEAWPVRAAKNEPLTRDSKFLSYCAMLCRLKPSALKYRFLIASVQSSQPLSSDRPSVSSPGEAQAVRAATNEPLTRGSTFLIQALHEPALLSWIDSLQ